MTSGEALMAIAADHPAFAGHFPGAPIVPGVVLLDEALHAIGERMAKDLSACHINSIKFFSPLRPGEPARVCYEAQSNGVIRFDVMSGERKVAAGALRP